MSVFMGPTVDSGIKTPKTRIPLLQSNLKSRHVNTTHHLSNVMLSWRQPMSFKFYVCLENTITKDHPTLALDTLPNHAYYTR